MKVENMYIKYQFIFHSNRMKLFFFLFIISASIVERRQSDVETAKFKIQRNLSL